jgi:hypothetical protein
VTVSSKTMSSDDREGWVGDWVSVDQRSRFWVVDHITVEARRKEDCSARSTKRPIYWKRLEIIYSTHRPGDRR